MRLEEAEHPRTTPLAEVLAVLADLDRAGCRTWVGGGWGVDALVGRQTRDHRDLDLAVDAAHEGEALAVLARRGYRVTTDWRPVRVELVAPGRGWVDVHAVTFPDDGSGHGRQPGLDGTWFDYPPEALGHGRLGGRRVPCLTRDQQLLFHQGYRPRAVDLHDLALLDRLA